MPDSISTNHTSTTSDNPIDHYEDPLFLSSADQPHLQLATYLFDGSNFITWKRDVLMTLLAKNKEGFVSGTCLMPSIDDRKYNQWRRCDMVVMKWLLNSIAKPIRETVQYASSSQEIWTELLDRYGQINTIELYQLKKELSNIVQENASLLEYYSDLKRLWENIDQLDPLPSCTCGAMKSCSCQMMKRLCDREVQSKLIQLLMGLNSAYETVKTHVLSMEPLPPINKTLGLLQKIEKQKYIHEIASDTLPETHSFAAGVRADQKKYSGNNWKRPRVDVAPSMIKECDNCFRKGHTIDECFKLKDCSFCNVKGHIRAHCFKLKAQNARLNSSAPTSSTVVGVNTFKRAAHNVEVMDNSGTLDDTPGTPLDVMPFQSHSNKEADSSSFSYPTAVSSEFVQGIVHNVMSQVMQAFSESTSAPMNSVNFAGPFK